MRIQKCISREITPSLVSHRRFLGNISLVRCSQALIIFLILICTAHFSLAENPELSAPQLMEAGKAQLKRGSLGQAAISWTEAARTYEQQGQPKEQTEALILLADSLQQMGQYRRAITTLDTAYRIAQTEKLQARSAVILDRLGNAHFALGLETQAASLLNSALITPSRNQLKTNNR